MNETDGRQEAAGISVSRHYLPADAVPAVWDGGAMERRKRLSAQSRKAYVEGMKRYQEQGIPVLIDGKTADDRLWGKIFEVREDGSFYMGDYILAEEPMLYGPRKRLKEIRFDIVYNR